VTNQGDEAAVWHAAALRQHAPLIPLCMRATVASAGRASVPPIRILAAVIALAAPTAPAAAPSLGKTGGVKLLVYRREESQCRR
jgi:hypothetical protein